MSAWDSSSFKLTEKQYFMPKIIHCTQKLLQQIIIPLLQYLT